MKKFIAAILVSVMLFMLCACGGGGASSAIENVVTQINDIGTVTLESETAIKAAEDAYSNLTEEQKAKVENYATLTEAREALEELKAVQEFACKLITKCAELFNNPLQIKIKNVWHYKSDSRSHYFTYEIEAPSKAGFNTLTGYFGNSYPFGFSDLSDEEIEDAKSDFYFGLGGFEENGIDAMQKGEEMDAEYIQNYLLKHVKP